MATSGKINGTAKNNGSATSNYSFWCDWTRNSYSIENNTSNITIYLRIECTAFADGAWNLDDKPTVTLSVGGAAKTPNSITVIDTRNYVTCTFATWTGDVKHNPDGSPNCSIVASFVHYGSNSLDAGSLSGSANLDTIPQATTLDSLTGSNSYFTGTMTYKYTPKAATLYNQCYISLNMSGTHVAVKTINLGTKSAAQQTATVTLTGSELATICKKLTSTSSGVLRFTLRTYSDSGYSKQVGSSTYKELTLSIPNPTLDSLTCATSHFAGTLTYKYTPKSAVLYNRCTITLNVGGTHTTVKTINIGTKSASQQTATVVLSESELSTIFGKLTSANSGVLRFTFSSYAESGYTTQVGNAVYKEITLSIPDTTFDSLACATSYLTGAMTYKYTPKTAAMYNRCKITLNVNGTHTTVKTINLGKKAASQQTATVTLSDSELTTVFGKLTSANSGVLRFTFSTYSESGYSKQVGSTSYKEITLNTPDTTLDSLSCATSYFTGELTYKYTPKTAVLYNQCTITLNVSGTHTTVKSIGLGQKAASQQPATVTLSASELSTVYNKLPATDDGILRFTIRTYSDSGYSKRVGKEATKEISLSIPNVADTKPTVSMTLSPVGSLPSAFSGLYVKGKTKVKATLSATPKYSATAKSYSMKVGSVSYGSGNSYTSDYLSKAGSTTVYGYATDSRGFTGSTSKSITVIDYDKPKLPIAEAFRCDKDGNAADNGTYLKIKAKRSYSPVKSGSVQKNFCAIRYRWKPENGSYSSWTTILDGSASSDEVITGALLAGGLATNTTYSVQVRAVDDIGDYSEVTIVVPTEVVFMHRTKNAVAYGKYVEGENIFDVAWDARFRGDIYVGDTGMTLREYILSVISEGG